MKFFPESALQQLEYEKVKILLAEYCKSEYAKDKAVNLRIHTKKEFIDLELRQSYEYKLLLQTGLNFPNDFISFPLITISPLIKPCSSNKLFNF
jgi:DNA mismatch repair protein MutS2